MGSPNLMVSSSLHQITFTDKRRVMPSLPLSGPVFSNFNDLGNDMYYYDYRFTVPSQFLVNGPGHNIVISVVRYRAEPDNSALPSLFINPEAPTTRTNIMRRRAQSLTHYPLAVMRGDLEPSCWYLLLGDTARSKLRLLFLFSDNRPPELKFLDFSWHDMILDIDDFYANRDANPINDVDRYSIGPVDIPRQYNRKSDDLSMSLRSKDSHPQRDTTESASSQG